MPTTFTAPTWSYITPDDGNLGSIIAELVSLVPDTGSTRSLIYGWTDPTVFTSLVEAQKRGVDAQGGCDHSQSIGPVEQRNLTAFFSQIKRWDSRGNILWWIGTSDQSDQIIHAKTIWVNWNESSPYPYTQEPTVYSDWRDYVRSGYPTVLRGSYNWSTTAHKQVNTMDISPSPELCHMYQTTYNRTRTYNLQHNSSWNTPPSVTPQVMKFIPDE